MERETIPVSGMSCNGCEQNVENALRKLDGVTRVEADHEADTVEVVADDKVGDGDLHDVVEQAGYDVAA